VLANVLSVFFSLNLLLCIFNLLPVPPLDGSSLPLLVLPETAAQKYFDAMRSPILQLIGFMIISRGLGSFFQPILAFAASLLHPGLHFR
jgi:Zn-dependent protease